MLEYLKDWRVWVVAIVVIIVIVWVMVKIERAGKTTTTQTKSAGTESTDTDTDTKSTGTKSTDTKSTDTKSIGARTESRSSNKQLVVVPKRAAYSRNAPPSALTKEDAYEIDECETPEEFEVKLEKLPGQSEGEHACYAAMGNIFRVVPQTKVRNLEALRNPLTGHILELDVYVPQFNVACEYHGRQHYEYVPFFHRKGHIELEYQHWKDKFKLEQCDKMGVFLVTVPYIVKTGDIEAFIRNELIKGGVLAYEIEN